MPPPRSLLCPQQNPTEPDSQSVTLLPLHPTTHAQTRRSGSRVMAMAQGRGSATQGFALGLLALCLLLGADVAGAATYNVDWSFNADSWSSGKNFRAGDVLVFNYNPSLHNVVAVDAGGYNSCQGSGATYNSGSDHVTLGAGRNYFVCSLSGHCGAGMKMAVNAN